MIDTPNTRELVTKIDRWIQDAPGEIAHWYQRNSYGDTTVTRYGIAVDVQRLSNDDYEDYCDSYGDDYPHPSGQSFTVFLVADTLRKQFYFPVQYGTPEREIVEDLRRVMQTLGTSIKKKPKLQKFDYDYDQFMSLMPTDANILRRKLELLIAD